MSDCLLELKQVGKFLGPRQVLRNIELKVCTGQVLIIAGGNGAGKSTLLRMIAGLLEVDAGKLWRSSRLRSAYQGHDSALYPELTVLENLQFFLNFAIKQTSVDELLTIWHLNYIQDQKICDLSKGQVARVALAITFGIEADLLLLDEPTANLDQQFSALVEQQISNYIRSRLGSACIIATHNKLNLALDSTSYYELANSELSLNSAHLHEGGL